MTTSYMTEQKRAILTDAINKYFNSLRSRTFANNNSGIKVLGCILYLLKKGCLSIKSNVCDKEGVILCSIESFDIDLCSDWTYDEHNPIRAKELSLVYSLPDNNSLADLIINNLNTVKTDDRFHLPIFDFVNTILKIDDCQLLYADAYDLAIKLAFSGYNHGQFTQPIEFAEFASALLDVKDKSIFNPFSGLMSFATTLEGFKYFEGIEKDSLIYEIGLYRTLLAGIESKVSCIHGDVSNWPDVKYDVILSSPPISGRITLLGGHYPLQTELVCLKKFGEITTPQGVLLTFVAPGVLFRGGQDKFVRKELTEQNYLDTIIELPANLWRPYTSLSPVAILLKKDRSNDAPIKMIDASKFIVGDKNSPKLDVEALFDCISKMYPDCSCRVSREDIRENDYTWSVANYIKDDTISHLEGFDIIKLKEVASLIKGEKRFEEQKGHLAMIAGLSPDGADCVRTVDSFEETDNLSKASRITEPVILLSSIRVLKPTYCEASPEKPLFIHPHVMALRVNNVNISPTYLCLELSRRSFPTVGIIPRISRSAIMETLISLPALNQKRSIEEQNNLYNEAFYNFKISKAKEQGFQSLIDKMKTEYINTVRMRKHDMMPYIREMGSVARLMRMYIHSRGTAELKELTTELLDNFDDAYNHLFELIDVFSQENEFGTPEIINIEKYLREFVSKHTEKTGYSLDYFCDVSSLQTYGRPVGRPKRIYYAPVHVKIDGLSLRRLIMNIVDNACIHGFTDSNRNDYKLEISLTVVQEGKEVQIDFSNNGTPLPAGLDKERYGILGEKAGITGKTGQGGYIVKSIVEHYKGDYDIFMDGLNTVVRIILPISNSVE